MGSGLAPRSSSSPRSHRAQAIEQQAVAAIYIVPLRMSVESVLKCALLHLYESEAFLASTFF